MRVPPHVQSLIDHEVAAVQSDPQHVLLPFRRLGLYEAFGPTFASANYEERIKLLQDGQARLTPADRVRARLAILTAHRVLPLWDSSLEEAGLLTAQWIEGEIRFILEEMVRLYLPPEAQPAYTALFATQPLDYAQLQRQVAALEPHQLDRYTQAVMQEWTTAGLQATRASPTTILRVSLDPRLAQYRSVYHMPSTETPMHILQLAEGVLEGLVDPGGAVSQSHDIHHAMGNFLGYEEEEFPARAYDVCEATYEALRQALGLGPFDRLQVDPTTTDAVLMGEGAAAAAAVKAYSGVFEGNISTTAYDPEKRLEFWLWWLTEAIPAAWAAEEGAETPPVATMPFTETVRVTKYATGIWVVFDDIPPDQSIT